MNAGRCCRSRGRWHGLPFRSRNSPDGPNLLFRVPGGPWRRRLTVKLGRFAVDSRHARGPQGDRTGPRPQSLPVPAVCSATASHEIGRAPSREREGPYEWITVVDGALNKKNKKSTVLYKYDQKYNNIV